MTIYGYARSARQEGLNEQIEQLKSAGCEEIYYEVISGVSKERPHFNTLLNKLNEGDTVIITSLDRISRTFVDAVNTIRELLSKGIIVQSLDMGIINNSPITEIPIDLLSLFGEYEKKSLVDRLQAGKAIAKQNPNFREGRKAIYSQEQFDEAMRLKETYSYSQVAQMTGISIATLKRESRKRKQQAEEEN